MTPDDYDLRDFKMDLPVYIARGSERVDIGLATFDLNTTIVTIEISPSGDDFLGVMRSGILSGISLGGRIGGTNIRSIKEIA